VNRKTYTLDQALTWIGSAALMVLFVPTSLYLTQVISSSAERGLIDRGYSLGRALSPQLVQPILWGDSLTIREILQRTTVTNSEIRYIFVEHAKGKKAEGHSPDLSCTPALMKLWQDNRGQIIRFRSREEPIMDVSAPILDGRLGFLHVGLSRSQVAEETNRLRWVLGLVLASGIMIVLVGARIMSVQVSRPLRRLEKMVSLFPQHPLGRMDLKLSSIPELNSLGRGFQEMAGRLEILQREQEATQKSMIQAERLAAVGELSAGLAHEICNPLDGMLEGLGYLEEDPGKSARAAKYYPMFRESLRRIAEVMGRMLTFARSGQKVTLDPYSLPDVIQNLKLLVEAGNQERKVHIDWQCEGQCLCMCEPQGLAQASLNLVLNATEAAAQGDSHKVKVHAECDSQWVYLSVEDSGPGIPDELRERIFDAFFTTKPVGKGTGLGLSVSRQLIRATGGDLELSPERSVLGGAKFVIRLPKAPECGVT
jgi:signal transduction histidine kinase